MTERSQKTIKHYIKSHFLGFFLIASYALVMVWTLPAYGINEDSPGHFLRGQAYFELLFQGKQHYDQSRLPSPIYFIPGQRISSYKLNAWEANLAPQRPIESVPGITIQAWWKRYQERNGRQSFYKHEAWNGAYFAASDGPGHPPVSDILAAGFNRLFFEKLGWLDDIEAYYLYIVTTAVLALIAVYWFTWRSWGTWPAILALVTLETYPLFFADSHFNLKDIPLLAYWTACIVVFFQWLKQPRWRWFFLFVLFFSLGVGTKLNMVLVILVLAFGLVWQGISLERRSGHWRRVFLFLAGVAILSPVLLIIIWPYLWEAPFQKLWQLATFYYGSGSLDLTIQQPSRWLLPGGINVQGVVLVVASSPPLVLLLVALGIIRVFRSLWLAVKGGRENTIAESLVLGWLIVPIGRTLWPKTDIFDSLRQFAEFLPAMAILAGIGGGEIVGKIREVAKKYRVFARARSTVVVIPVLIYILSLLVVLVRFHPNQNVYINSLFGGPRGALAGEIIGWQSSYDNPYRQAVNWLNLHAPQGAKLAYLDGTMLAISPLWLREDIQIGSYFSGFDRQGEYIISIIYSKPPVVFPYLYLDRFIKPVYEVKVGETVLAKVWRNEAPAVRDNYRRQTTRSGPFSRQQGRDERLGWYWETPLDQEIALTSLVLKVPVTGCSSQGGLWLLNNYFVPERRDIDKETIVFWFPAEATKRIRLYALAEDACLLRASIKTVGALER